MTHLQCRQSCRQVCSHSLQWISTGDDAVCHYYVHNLTATCDSYLLRNQSLRLCAHHPWRRLTTSSRLYVFLLPLAHNHITVHSTSIHTYMYITHASVVRPSPLVVAAITEPQQSSCQWPRSHWGPRSAHLGFRSTRVQHVKHNPGRFYTYKTLFPPTSYAIASRCQICVW